MRLYNEFQDAIREEFVMPKRKLLLNEGTESFGERLARLRKAAGYSLRELAEEVGISHIMLVHYEKHSGYPSAQLLPRLAKVLGVSADQLLGIEPVKENGRGQDNRLWRRFRQVEKLPPNQRRPIIQFLDAFLEKEKLKKAS
jgi:transcriptional regulator with XRE-family HTH domain